MAFIKGKRLYAILANDEVGKDIIKEAPELTDEELERRIDEFFGNKGSKRPREVPTTRWYKGKRDYAYSVSSKFRALTDTKNEYFENDLFDLQIDQLNAIPEEEIQKIESEVDTVLEGDHTNIRTLTDLKFEVYKKIKNARKSNDFEKAIFKDMFADDIMETWKKIADERIEKGKQELEAFDKFDTKILDDDEEFIKAVKYINSEERKKDKMNGLSNHTQNCQRCASSFLLTMKGYKVKAKIRDFGPLDEKLREKGWGLCGLINRNGNIQGQGKGVGEPEIPYLNIDYEPIVPKGRTNCSKALQIKEIARRVKKEPGIYYLNRWYMDSDGGGAHVSIVMERKGQIWFIDPQTGDAERYEGQSDLAQDRARWQTRFTNIVRVDNLDFSEGISMMAESKKEE